MAKRVDITLADDLVVQAKQFASNNGLSLSALIASSLIRVMNERAVADALVGIGDCFQVLCQRPDIDEETLQQLEAYSIMLQAYKDA